MKQEQREKAKKIYKAVIDKAYDLDVIIEGVLLVKFPDGSVLELKIRRDE